MEKILTYDVFGKSTGITTSNIWLALRHEIYISWDAKSKTSDNVNLLSFLCFEPQRITLLKVYPWTVGYTCFWAGHVICWILFVSASDWIELGHLKL